MTSEGSRVTETHWHQTILVVLLVTGACLRFYQIDHLGLTASELAMLSVCSENHWFAMLESFNDLTSMPPLFPTLVCAITSWTSTNELFVRLLPALAGVAGIYMTYLIGRDFISATAGLLAAALITLDYGMILASREATLYTLLALLVLAQFYCFSWLFFSSKSYSRHALSLSYTGTNSQILWFWQPAFPCDARYLLGFWITAALAFYTSPMAIIPLLVEFFASLYILKRSRVAGNVLHAMTYLWLPILLALLAWYPMLDKHREWALQGNLLGLQPWQLFWTQAGNLLPVDTAFHLPLALLGGSLLIYVLLHNIRMIIGFWPGAFFACCTGILFSSLLAFAVLEPAGYLSFLAVWILLLLMLVAPVALTLDRVAPQKLHLPVLGLLVLGLVVTGVQSNKAHFLYKRSTDADFRLVASILLADEEFMAGRRKIYVSSALFNHYLKQKGVIRESSQLIDIHNPEPDFHEAAINTRFYYLEYRPNKKTVSETKASRELKKTYRLHCESRLGKIRVMKFTRDNTPATSENPDCLSYLPRMGAM